MFVHPIVPHRRCDGRRPSRRQRLAGVVTALLATGISAGIGAGFSRHSSHDLIVLLCMIVGLAFVIGIVLARVIGGRSRV